MGSVCQRATPEAAGEGGTPSPGAETSSCYEGLALGRGVHSWLAMQ